MRPLPAALLATTLVAPLLGAPSLAHAGRFTLGVSLGRTQAEADAGLDASSTASLWGRANLGKRFAIDLEYGKVSTEADATRVRSLNLVGRMTLADLRGGTIHPMVLLALGSDTAESTDYTHGEFGAAIELDLARDFVIGADFRFGERTRDPGDEPLITDGPVPAFRQPFDLSDGSYRAGRLYLGVRL